VRLVLAGGTLEPELPLVAIEGDIVAAD